MFGLGFAAKMRLSSAFIISCLVGSYSRHLVKGLQMRLAAMAFILSISNRQSVRNLYPLPSAAWNPGVLARANPRTRDSSHAHALFQCEAAQKHIFHFERIKKMRVAPRVSSSLKKKHSRRRQKDGSSFSAK